MSQRVHVDHRTGRSTTKHLTGYALYWELAGLGVDCTVSNIPPEITG